jgi:ribosomal protein S18 acetylase RimI-like enzyme
MNTDSIEIAVARESDLDGILELQAANHISNGGTLSASFSRAQLERTMKVMPLLVARRGNDILGFLVCWTTDAVVDIPIIVAMLDSYPQRAPDAYVYGPICIDRQQRGRGLAQLLFEDIKRRLPEREGVLFIRRDNEPSIRSHHKMGMKEASRFSYGSIEHIVLSYVGGAPT